MAPLILASTSRYRRELLGRLRVPFEARPPTATETELAGEPPERMAARLAAAKAGSIRDPEALVIGSDQVPSLRGRVLRKPGQHAAALEQLRACQGECVIFHTAVELLDNRTGRRWSHVDRTEVHFRRLQDPAIERYLRLEQPYDCAGSFKAEGLGVVLFERIDTCDPTALIGLPLIWLAGALRAAGLDPLMALESGLRVDSTPA